MDEVFLTDYEKEKMQDKLVNSAYVEGKEAGIDERNIEIAKTMLKKEMDINTISECVGLSIEELNAVKKELK